MYYLVFVMFKRQKQVFILHGWAFETSKWQPFLDELKKIGLSPTLLKAPGLTAPLDRPWTLDDYVEWLRKEIRDSSPAKPDQNNKNTKVVVLGHSFGGQIATRFAAVYPKRVARLILIDSAGVRDRAWWPTLKRGIFGMAARVGKVFVRAEWARRLIYFLARERDYLNAPPLLRRTMSTVLDDEVIADMPNVQAKTLLIWGREDSVTPLSTGQLFAQRIPNNRLEVIGGARHAPHFSHPAQVARVIDQFLYS